MEISDTGYILHKIEKVSDEILRDYFAAKAMQAMIGAKYSIPDGAEYYAEEIITSAAYSMADAMLKARQTND